MITPQEIENKDFTKSFRGYDEDEVDEFLDLIIIDMQKITDEITRLRQENEELRAENDEHKKSQKRVMDTLDSAKKLMRDISESAEKRADIIIRNAKMDAEMILNEAKSSAGKYAGADGEELRDRVAYFRSRFRQLLLDELDSMDSKGGDLLSALEKEFVSTPVGGGESLGEFTSFDELPEGSTTTISEEEMEKALNEVKDDFDFAVKIGDEE
ncbi:MAG: DivIVA domain-containing protein [Firmicutes bacterium]|nr:DivIVA domain-containing protein [Bacillota bacterium]